MPRLAKRSLMSSGPILQMTILTLASRYYSTWLTKTKDGRITESQVREGLRGSSGGDSREYLGRGPPSGSGRCFNCGINGHWARDWKAGDWKNKCHLYGERSHIERNCHNNPKSQAWT